MSFHKNISSSDLFVVVPKSNVSPGRLSDHSFVQSAPLLEVLDSTFFELTTVDYDNSQYTLRIWEIRLMILLFTDQLSAAKREATALNNALYLHEHPGASKSPMAMPNSAPVSASNDSDKNLSNVGKAQLPAYPLPNNNDGQISDSLLVLLLNLKTAPNLARVNEIYRVCYQKRLKGETDSPAETEGMQPNFWQNLKTQTKLMALAYEVVAVLFVSRHYSTLVSFLTSIRNDLEILITKIDSENLTSYKEALQMHNSNVIFMWLLAKVHVRRGCVEWGADMWGPLYQKELAKVGGHTWDALTHVSGKISPKLGGSISKVKIESETISMEQISNFVAEDMISVRTICCVLAFWGVAATHDGQIIEGNFTIKCREDSSGFDSTYDLINSKWAENYNKLYGLE